MRIAAGAAALDIGCGFLQKHSTFYHSMEATTYLMYASSNSGNVVAQITEERYLEYHFISSVIIIVLQRYPKVSTQHYRINC